jgi:hypothetical protein
MEQRNGDVQILGYCNIGYWDMQIAVTSNFEQKNKEQGMMK